jgi:hypothetical protein
MDKNKSQAFNFAYEVVPVMFHTQTTDFITYLKKDGLQFLQFWWEYIADKVNEGQERSFEGMDYTIIQPDKNNTLVIISLPKTQEEGEVIYLLLHAKPERRFAWVKLPNTRVIALINKEAPENPEGTELGDITPRGAYVRLRKGPVPTVENMTKIGVALVNAQKR